MKIILLNNIPGVGHAYDVKEVSDGYARNYILPRKLGKLATQKEIKKIASKRIRVGEEKKVHDDLLMKSMADLSEVNILINKKANEKGHLFAGVGKEEIVLALKKQAHLDIGIDYITLGDPIKEIGERNIAVRVGDKSSTFKLTVGSI